MASLVFQRMPIYLSLRTVRPIGLVARSRSSVAS